MKQIYIFITILCISIFAFAQSEQIDQIRYKLKSEDKDSVRILLLIDLANECRYYSPENAKKYFEEIVDLAEQEKNQYAKGLAYKGIGTYFFDIGKYDSAIYFLSLSQKIFHRLDDKKALSEVMRNSCYICVAEGEFNEALNAGQQTLKIALESGNYKEIQNAYYFMGYLYRLIGEIELSEQYLLIGIEISIQNNDTLSKAALLSELGRAYETKNDLTQAINYYNEANLLFGNLEGQNALVYKNFCKGEVYRCGNEYNRAIFQYAEAYKIVAKLNNHFIEVQLVVKIGISFIALARQGKSVYAATRTIESLGFNSIEDLLSQTCNVLKLSKNKTDLLECYGLLAEISQIKGQFKKAYQYYNYYLVLKTEIQNNNKADVLAEMLTSFEEDEQNRKIELLKATAIANDEKIGLQRSQQFIIVIFAILLILVGFGLRNRIKVIRRTKEKLEDINQQLESEKRRAERSERFKEKFLTNVSHEIRTPMNAIMGVTNILIKKKHYKDQEKYLEAMSISSRHLLGLINAILDLSKFEAGKVNLEETVFTLDEISESIREELKPLYSRKGLYFKITIDNKIPEFLKGDSKMLRQIILPLCRNGIEISETGGIYLVTKLMATTEKMAIVGFTIKDTGIGIRKELHDKLFSEIIGEVQFDKQEIESSGLELVLIKQMVELQGGSISLDSLPGKGTTFFIELPFAIARGRKDDDAKATKEAKVKPAKNIHILLVEDNEFNIMVAQEALESAIENVSVDIATNGKIALNKVENTNYDIILMDVQMPVMNGYDATIAIRKMKGMKSEIPVIAMSANIMKTEMDKCFEAGMNGYIPKPFDTEILVTEIYKHLEKTKE